MVRRRGDAPAMILGVRNAERDARRPKGAFSRGRNPRSTLGARTILGDYHGSWLRSLTARGPRLPSPPAPLGDQAAAYGAFLIRPFCSAHVSAKRRARRVFKIVGCAFGLPFAFFTTPLLALKPAICFSVIVAATG